MGGAGGEAGAEPRGRGWSWGGVVLTVHGLKLGRPWCLRNQREPVRPWVVRPRVLQRSRRERSMSLATVSVLPSNEPFCPRLFIDVNYGPDHNSTEMGIFPRLQSLYQEIHCRLEGWLSSRH